MISLGLMNIITRSYLADPEGTERDLNDTRNEGLTELITGLRVDHQAGRLAENYAMLTGKRVLSMQITSSQVQNTVVCDSCVFGVCDIHEPIQAPSASPAE